MKRIHFIALGGSAMHNLAIALSKKGYIVSGSDDEIREPSLSRLKNAGILPNDIGWDTTNISTNIDAVILGMHARVDNPELLEAQKLGVKIYSYPEFLYEATKDKKRVVIGGSHGKTSITSMILHIMKYHNIKIDFMVGAQLKGFDTMVELHMDTKIALFEGDEYLASPIDKRPKFHLYRPHIAVISGVAWDHINVFPTYASYEEQFVKFFETTEPKAKVFYCANDDALQQVVFKNKANISLISYSYMNHQIKNGVTYVKLNQNEIALKIFGKHNMFNLQAAYHVCKELGINDQQFLQAIPSFEGAAKRLELVERNEKFTLYKDFAHSPSKVKATLDAVVEQFSSFKIVACLELHTFSSLNQNFLAEYEGTLNKAHAAIVYYNKQVITHKKLKEITNDEVKSAFNNNNLKIATATNEVKDFCKSQLETNTIFLMMSSGNFDGIDFEIFANELK